LLAATASIWAALPGTSAAQTSVSISGRNITITVPIDAVGIDRQTAREWKRSAESLWNGAFNSDDYPFKGCFTLKLVLDTEAHDYDYPAQAGRHMIFGSHGANRNQAKGTIAGNGDPYKSAADGNFDESFGDPSHANYVAHEVGHLLGLPDEYREVGTEPRRTEPLDGRAGTLMADGGRIDPTLLKRLVKRLRDETHNIPDCWKGQLGATVNNPVPSGTQHYVSNLSMTVATDGDSVVSGDMTGSDSQTLELSKCPSATVTPGTLKAKLSGSVREGQLTLQVTERQSTPPRITPCPGAGAPGIMGPIFKFPYFDDVFRQMSREQDGTHGYDREWRIASGPYYYTVRYTLKLSPAGR
jgi:hypothetical protein